jgi:MarR family 2-MHQ and catechol resistance regulon transcriptional repressor
MSNDSGYRLTVAVLEAADALVRGSQKLFRPHGLTAAQFNVLNLIARSDSGMSQRELGDKLVVDRSNVTGLLDRMERAGWVRRDDDPGDRRIYRVSLTPVGRKLWERVNPRYVAAVSEVSQGLSGNQIRDCVELLVQLRDASDGWAAAPEREKSGRTGRSHQG